MSTNPARRPFDHPPARGKVEWVPAAEVAEALGVDQAAMGEVAYRAKPRLAQLPDGRQQLQTDAARVWLLAESLGVELPARFAAKR